MVTLGDTWRHLVTLGDHDHQVSPSVTRCHQVDPQGSPQGVPVGGPGGVQGDLAYRRPAGRGHFPALFSVGRPAARPGHFWPMVFRRSAGLAKQGARRSKSLVKMHVVPPHAFLRSLLDAMSTLGDTKCHQVSPGVTKWTPKGVHRGSQWGGQEGSRGT